MSDDLRKRIAELERENRWLRGIIMEHIGTDAENVDPDGPPSPEDEAEERRFWRAVDERRRRMFGRP